VSRPRTTRRGADRTPRGPAHQALEESHVTRHPIRTLFAAGLAAALLAPAAASAEPQGWVYATPQLPGDGTTEMQTGTSPKEGTIEETADTGYGFGTKTVALSGAGLDGTLSARRHTSTPLVGLGDPPADEPEDPPAKPVDDEDDEDDAADARNQAFADAMRAAQEHQAMINRMIRGIAG
jgi:hypothetical protein